MASEVAAEPKQAALGSKPAPGLYLVSTPIGNLGDISLRALDTLRNADAIICEDSRVTRKLTTAHGIETPLLPYHEHNAAKVRPKILNRLLAAESIALVSDAGTPLISDPGYKLVQEALAADIAVTTLPGASAPLSALLLSGLPSDRFFFAGFLPAKSGARRKALEELAGIDASLIFFESARRLQASLTDMAAVLGTRPAAVARELTKLFEEVRRGDLRSLAEHYGESGAPKGEIVVVVGPAADQETSREDLDSQLLAALETLSLRDAAAAVAVASGRPRREVYARALKLGRSRSEDGA